MCVCVCMRVFACMYLCVCVCMCVNVCEIHYLGPGSKKNPFSTHNPKLQILAEERFIFLVQIPKFITSDPIQNISVLY